MKTIKASEFKATCLQLMDEVAKTGEAIVITKNGKPISQLVPYRTKPKTITFTRERKSTFMIRVKECKMVET